MKRKAKKPNHARKERTLTEAQLKQISAGFHFDDKDKIIGFDIEFEDEGGFSGVTGTRRKS